MGDPRTVPAVCSAEETAFQRSHTGPSADPAVASQSSSEPRAAWRAANPAFSMAVDPDDFPEPHMEARRTAPCCVGVDQPGVGRVHAANCPNRAVAERIVDDLLGGPVSRGSAYRAGEVPPALHEAVSGIEFTGTPSDKKTANSVTVDRFTYFDPRVVAAVKATSGVPIEVLTQVAEGEAGFVLPKQSFKDFAAFREAWEASRSGGTETATSRDGLLSRLLFAARALAMANLDDAFADGTPIGSSICRECHLGEALDPEEHSADCRTGRVLKLLSELGALPAVAKGDDRKEKEKAPERETAEADDGIRARGLAERVCLKCGSRAGVWIAEVKPESEVWLHDLALNQCVGSAGIDGGHVLYTHQCASLAHRGINALFGDGLKINHEKLAEDWRSVCRSPQTYRAFGRMDEAIKEASPSQYIVFGRSLATGTDLYFVIDDLSQVADRRMCIMQSPTIFTPNVVCTPKGGAA